MLFKKAQGLVRRSSASVAQVTHGVHGSVIDSHLVMHVGPRGAPTHPYVTDDFSPLYANSGRNREAGQVAIPGRYAESMIEHDQPAVSVMLRGLGDFAIRRRSHRV